MRRGLLLLIGIIGSTSLLAQVQDTSMVRYDTVLLKKDHILTIADSALFAKKDTIFVLPDTLDYIINVTPTDKTKQFYQTLKDKFYQTRITKELFDLLFTDPPEASSEPDYDNTEKSEDPYKPYEGKIIGNITIKKLNVFGTNIEDTTRQVDSWIVNTGNKFHIDTRSRVIRKGLIVEKGDVLDPLELADNERIIRELPYIQDARIRVSPREDSDTVDLILVTKDVWSISASVNPDGFTGGALQIDDKNILGFGHELDNYIILSPDETQSWGYEGIYRIPNIYGTFITSEVNYANTYLKNTYGVHLYRNFITPETKYAGGIEVSRQKLLREIILEDTSYLQFPYAFNLQDVWLGRSFSFRKNQERRSQLIFSGRFTRRIFTERPVVDATSNRDYHSNSLILGSIGYFSREYYKGNFIYGFGRTEDIPEGSLIELIGGHENGEFYDRYYTGIRLAKGKLFAGKGYLFGEANIGGFLNKGNYEQGVINFRTNMFSDLYHIKRYTLRQFLNIEYTKGFNRFSEEFITINNERGIRGLSSTFLRGTRKLAFNAETLVFTPFQPIGFQFAFFAFVDVGLISHKTSVFKGDTYTGFGLGLRIRNDNLTFNTFQIRLGYYPRVPIDASNFDLDVSGTTDFRHQDFFMDSPAVIPFY